MTNSNETPTDNLDQLPVVDDDFSFSSEDAIRTFETLLYSDDLGILIADSEGSLLLYNRGAEKIFGYSKQEGENLLLADMVVKEQRQALEQLIHSSDEEIFGATNENKFLGLHKTGSQFPIELSCNPMGTGDERKLLFIVHDLSNQNQNDEALLKSEAFFRAVYDHNTDIMILTDEDNNIIWSNTAWYRDLGYSPGVQKTPFDNIHQEDKNRVEQAWLSMLRGERDFDNIVYRYREGSGDYAYLETTIRQLPGEPYYYTRSHNITPRKKMEESIARRTKYLELTLAVSTLFNSAEDLATIAQILKENLDLDEVCLQLFSPNSAFGATFKKYRLPKNLRKKELEGLVKKEIPSELEELLQRHLEGEEDRTILLAPLIDAQRDRVGILVMVKKGGVEFAPDELGLIRNLVNTLSLVADRLGYLEDLKLRSHLDKSRADFSDRLRKCKNEEEVLDLSLSFFEKNYGIKGSIILLGKVGRFVFAKIRLETRDVSEKKTLKAFMDSAVLPENKGNPLFSFFEDPTLKIAFLNSYKQIFSGSKNETPGVKREIEKMIDRHRAISGQRIIAIKLPDIGILCGILQGSLLEVDHRSRDLIVNAISTTVKELRLERTREDIMRKNEILHKMDSVLRQIPMGDMKAKLDTIFDNLEQMIDLDGIVLSMPDFSDGEKTKVVSSRGKVSRSKEMVNLDLANYVMETGKDILLPHDTSAPDKTDEKDLDLPPEMQQRVQELYPAFYSAPIIGDINRQRRILGVLLLTAPEVFSQEERYIIYDVLNYITGTVKDELLYERERELATKDELTGLYNRRFFLRRADEMFKISRRYSKRFSIIMLDIDHFKKINDTFGHEAGDKALVAIAESLGRLIREVDVPGRYGGEEFIVLLPETDIEGAIQMAERIRSRIEDQTVPYEGNEIRFTISAGVSTFGENSRIFNGSVYEVQLVNGKYRIIIDDKIIAKVDIPFPADQDTPNEIVKNLFKGDPQEKLKKHHVQDLLTKLLDIDGLIGIADGCLYYSKVNGRNRVSHGAW